MMTSEANRAGLEGLRFIVVEDEPLVARAIVRMLERSECNVLGPFASTANTFEALARGEEFDGALLDINLGNELVYPLAEAMRKEGRPFAFLTGYSRSAIREDFRDRPMLEKPFSSAELLQFLSRTFAKKEER
ncbi:MAG: response regulator [Phycisphaerales bacterium]|nr:response regulator [Planctomycetota bacterium]